MSTIKQGIAIFQNRKENGLSPISNKTVKVYVRLVFRRIGEIDTLNEKYQAQASIEARWLVSSDKLLASLSSDDQKRLSQGKSIPLLKYQESHWHPQLFIENTFGDPKEQVRYSAKNSKYDQMICVCEHRDIKGQFWEKLELHHFPSDVQDLSISVTSLYFDDKVVLIEDPDHISGVNREAFVDQQEWSLYEHVDTERRSIKEFLFLNTDEEEDDEENETRNNMEDPKRSILTVTCHAARHSNYFYWNGFCLIFLITLVSFCIFAIPPNLIANRLQASCTLLLTSITFRWTVNRSLPTISYLTILDKYAIMCIFVLVTLCIWHTAIGALIFLYIPDSRVTPTLWWTYIDQCVFLTATCVFILTHVILFAWLYFVPLKHRREMSRKDLNYRQSIIIKENKSTEYGPLFL